MIGNARILDGIYYFDDDLPENEIVQGFGNIICSIDARDQIMLWHFRLGHPSS